MGSAGAEAVIPLAAVVGILFALWQWFVVSRVKISGYYQSLGTSNGYHGGPVFEMDRTEEDALEGSTDERVIMAKCAEIQHAISVGVYLYLFPFPFIFSHFSEILLTYASVLLVLFSFQTLLYTVAFLLEWTFIHIENYIKTCETHRPEKLCIYQGKKIQYLKSNLIFLEPCSNYYGICQYCTVLLILVCTSVHNAI